MSRRDFSQQFPTHRDFSQQFPTHNDFSQQFPTQNDFSQQFPTQNAPVNTPPEALFQQDMEEVLRVQAEEERLARAREAYLRAKQARRNARAERRWAMGLPRVPSSEDDSSASSNEGYVSDDSFF